MRAFGRLALILGLLLSLSSCRFLGLDGPPAGTDLRLRSVGFGALPSWGSDSHAFALQAFRRSCDRIETRDRNDWFGPSQEFGRVWQWQRACRQADAVSTNDRAARAFFEANFRPHAVVGRGTFTGYYEVEVQGSRQRTGAYQFPVYAKPADLGNRSPYFSRTQIDQGALNGKGLELLYLASAADAFLLHVQGSGAITLTDGSKTRLSYAGNNGYSFRSISGALAAAGYDTSREGGSMVDYRRWLTQNPDKAVGVIQANPRFIFFTETRGQGPVGAQGVELTPGRSLAVDDAYLAYGMPIFLDTKFYDPNLSRKRDLERLVIAQDTGTAITGAVRGDFYWGTGDEALDFAGRMREEGQYYLLIPR